MRNVLLILCLLLANAKVMAAITYLGVQVGAGLTLATVTVNTTSTQFLMATETDFQAIAAGTLYDNQGNTYTLDRTDNDGSVARYRTYHAYVLFPNAATVISYSITATAYVTLAVSSWNGVALTNPVDATAGQGLSAAVSGTPGSVTPSMNGCLIYTAVNARNSGSPTIAGGYTTIVSRPFINVTQFATGVAYLIQTTAAAANQTWNYTTSTSSALGQVVIRPDNTSTGSGAMMMWFFGNR